MALIWFVVVVLFGVPALSPAEVSLSEKDWQTLKAIARNGGGGGVSIASSTTVPATCTPGTGPNALFLDTDDQILYACIANNVFGALGAGASGWPSTLTGLAATSEAAGESVSIRGKNAQANNGADFFQSSTGTFEIVCVVGNVRNACDQDTTLGSGKFKRIKNSLGVTIFSVEESTGRTAATIDCSQADTNCTVTNKKEFEFVSCQAGIADHIWNTPSTNAPLAACDANNTNSIKGYASFDDTVDEFIHASMTLPTGYVTGSLNVSFVWKAAAITGSAGLCMQAVRSSDGSSPDPALPAQSSSNCVSDTAKGTTLQENRAFISAVTCTSCVGGDQVFLIFSRDANASAVTDNLVGDVHVIRAVVTWKELQ